jgi:hypothetical protein
MARKVQIKVGQSWIGKDCGYPGVIFTITKIDGRTAYCTANPDIGIKVFAVGLDTDNYVVLDNRWKEWTRECKCGIYRGDCTYHKDG